MKNELERLYELYKSLNDRMDKAQTEQEKDVVRADYKEQFSGKIKEYGLAGYWAWRYYSESVSVGNKLMDVTTPPDEIDEFCDLLKEFGIKEFTYSSKNTNAIEDAVEFEQNGYKLAGTVKIIAPWGVDFANKTNKISALHFVKEA